MRSQTWPQTAPCMPSCQAPELAARGAVPWCRSRLVGYVAALGQSHTLAQLSTLSAVSKPVPVFPTLWLTVCPTPMISMMPCCP